MAGARACGVEEEREAVFFFSGKKGWLGFPQPPVSFFFSFLFPRGAVCKEKDQTTRCFTRTQKERKKPILSRFLEDQQLARKAARDGRPARRAPRDQAQAVLVL
jgi:hypothetical protein